MTPGVRGLGPVWSPTANYPASLSSVSLIYKTEKNNNSCLAVLFIERDNVCINIVQVFSEQVVRYLCSLQSLYCYLNAVIGPYSVITVKQLLNCQKDTPEEESGK